MNNTHITYLAPDYNESAHPSSCVIADLHACNALLNCCIREIILVQNSLPIIRLHSNATELFFSLGSYRLSADVSKPSLSGFFSLKSPIIATDSLGNQNTLDYLSFLSLINHQLSSDKQQALNLELFLQAKNSLENMNYFIEYFPKQQKHSFIDAEQGLCFGHEFHPTPKARYGINQALMCQVSPEISASFQLHYFKIPKKLLHYFASNTHLPNLIKEKDEFIYYPLHPWQAQYLLADEQLTQLLNNLSIESIGAMGTMVQATSSVRTIFAENDNYMYKFSLHLRLTNCLRKNAIYELKSAVVLSELLKQLPLTLMHSKVSLLYESSAFSLKLDKQAKHIKLQEIFGLILRDNLSQSHQSNSFVALKLFSQRPYQQPLICEILQGIATQHALSYRKSAQKWFQQYSQILVPFILKSFCLYGVVFEPHLQNVIVHLNDGNMTDHCYIRDLEGTKLCIDHWQSNPQKPKITTILYDIESSFRRTAYCLIFNHIATAIHYISQDDFALEKTLWNIVSIEIQMLLVKYKTDDFSTQQLSRLLHSEHLPYKANLLTRFLKSSDKNASYINLQNPLFKGTHHA